MVIVVLAALIALVAPLPAAALAPGTNGLIAFVSSRDQLGSGSDIYVMNADGTNPTRLTTDGGRQPVISPDGRRVAFQCSRDGNYEICLMNADGSNPINLTNHPAADAEPVFSPDGTRIAFSSQGRDSPFSGADIFVMNADGSNQTHLTTNRSGSRPVFSPDGKHIAFECSRDGNGEICLMSADGSNPINLTNHPAADAEPVFSPDGTRIAFSSQGRDSPFSGADIFVMNADGTNQTHLTTNRTGSHPVFSPDGKHIAFVSARDDTSFEIYVMNADGSNPVNRTNHPAYDAEPNWGVLAARGARATTTRLTVFPTPAFEGVPVVFLTQVTPRGAAGTIQILGGTTALGGPMPAAAGIAVRITTLPPGIHTLTAVFTPTNPGAFAPSTSAPVSLTVRTSS